MIVFGRIHFAPQKEPSPGKLYVKCQTEEQSHPFCPHGPTLLFYENSFESNTIYNAVFRCAAYRDKKDCSFYMPLSNFKNEHSTRFYEAPTKKYRDIREKVLKCSENSGLFYCHNCKILGFEHEHHDIAHELLRLSKTQLKTPTRFLKPLQNDKAQAQYFFDDKALKFFGNCFTALGITKVVCIGAPRLHEYLINVDIQSYLLDFDHRFWYFFDDDNFAWYNMCNNHFFDEEQKLKFLKFLENISVDDCILFFTDPPFGCRTEPIANTLRELTRLYNITNKLPHQPQPIFWIFPYFSVHYIQNEMPELEMCDYKVNYTDHNVYSNNGCKDNRKLGSPVRVFTNVPQHLLKLPVEEGYKYCASCQRYTALENRHCRTCDTCPSKNGSTYRHCEQCGICVKPNYFHCANCRRCAQVESHQNCQLYQRKQRCWICLQVGHTERSCEVYKKARKKFFLTNLHSKNDKQIRCLLCGNSGHNERFCKMRDKYIQEVTFLGETQLKFR